MGVRAFLKNFSNILVLMALMPVTVLADGAKNSDATSGAKNVIIKKTQTKPIIRDNNSAVLQQKVNDEIALESAKQIKERNKLPGPPRPELTATIVIPPAFERAREFHKGSAPVRVEGKWGLIDTKGMWVLAPTFSDIGEYNEEGLLPVKVDDKYGYIDFSGTSVTEFKYDAVKPFSEGLAAVKIDKQWGYILPDGNLYMKEGFEGAGKFKQGIAPVQFAEGWGYALREWAEGVTGNDWLLEPLFQQTFEFSDSHGVIKVEHMMGLVDLERNITIEPSYLDMKKYTEGLLPVSKKLGKWYFVDNRGKTVISETFQEVSSFSEGLASVKKQGKWGYINRFNDVIIPFKYNRAYDFHEGVAVVVDGDDRFFIDQQGRALSKKYADVYRVSEGYAAVKVGEQWGYVFIPPIKTDDSTGSSENSK